jgi:hypothetical protein
MDFTRLSKLVMGFGLVIVFFGSIKWLANQPEKFDPSKSEVTIFGRNDLGNMLNLQGQNAIREERRAEGTKVVIVGAVVFFVGLAMRLSIRPQYADAGTWSPPTPIPPSGPPDGTCPKCLGATPAGAKVCPWCANPLAPASGHGEI